MEEDVRSLSFSFELGLDVVVVVVIVSMKFVSSASKPAHT